MEGPSCGAVVGAECGGPGEDPDETEFSCTERSEFHVFGQFGVKNEWRDGLMVRAVVFKNYIFLKSNRKREPEFILVRVSETQL